MKMLIGQERPSSGQGELFGHDLYTDVSGIHRELSYVPQHDALLEKLSGFEHLLFYARFVALHTVFGMLSIAHDVSRRVKGVRESRCRHVVNRVIELMTLSEIAHRNAVNYSGGQKRRLSLGIALIGSSRILLLDGQFCICLYGYLVKCLYRTIDRSGSGVSTSDVARSRRQRQDLARDGADHTLDGRSRRALYSYLHSC